MIQNNKKINSTTITDKNQIVLKNDETNEFELYTIDINNAREIALKKYNTQQLKNAHNKNFVDKLKYNELTDSFEPVDYDELNEQYDLIVRTNSLGQICYERNEFDKTRNQNINLNDARSFERESKRLAPKHDDQSTKFDTQYAV